MSTSEPESFGVMKMRIHPNSYAEQYTKSLQFWKTVEQRYQERKRKWMEDNSKMLAAKLAALRAKNEYEKSKRLSLQESDLDETLTVDNENYVDVHDDEFSDVDPDWFKDPGDRYYSSLDITLWERIRTELMAIHRRAFNAPIEQHLVVTRGLVLSLLLAACLIIGGLFFLLKIDCLSAQEKYTLKSDCRINCSENSFIEEIIHSIFPAGSIEDEI